MRKCPIKTFRNALHEQFKEQEIVHERGIQKAYKNLISPLGNSKKLVKDIGEDHEAIEELKAYLSNWNSFNSLFDFTNLTNWISLFYD